MKLDVNKNKLMIQGVQFENNREFRSVLYAISSNMIEGWQPTKKDVIALYHEISSLRDVIQRD
ncbi:hypothetical protein P7H60_10515 [Vagococcus carniphilus]|uniref:Uncharacterized protein n=1 Tax=Vagococcus carniphilus TaxID=218144 RepID=A0AAW8U3W7_9ENTE|nr:hypothetical protein [Vagococcus carniphilus]MDT2830699.1 hypothetical protein [Vagococcus carniphilus]MDT2833002.1 hypothetical protein [Vagococcus carniphilus]MDT2839529.1 hypothetical protein [Vagococcus carniphilus]MDT2849573.1 hypothetical protein [Vagococcus carniphilus]MDT2853862.1 hypothetical protein [Vagococcus carniphilus]